MEHAQWLVRMDRREPQPVLLDERDASEKQVALAPLAEILGGLVDQASMAGPPGSDCEVEIGGRIISTSEEKSELGLSWVLHLSLGTTERGTSESDFAVRIRFKTAPP